jgi:hypothetical protein
LGAKHCCRFWRHRSKQTLSSLVVVGEKWTIDKSTLMFGPWGLWKVLKGSKERRTQEGWGDSHHCSGSEQPRLLYNVAFECVWRKWERKSCL